MTRSLLKATFFVRHASPANVVGQNATLHVFKMRDHVAMVGKWHRRRSRALR